MKHFAIALTLFLASCAPEQNVPITAPAAMPPAAVSVAGEQTPVRIIVVHWKIRKGMEQRFLEYWSGQARVENRSGLISEYLSSVADAERFGWINWRSLDPAWTSFFNVGLWRDEDAFQDQIGRFINNSRPPLEFEAERRERVFLAPQRWRVGQSALPAADPPGVR